MKKLLKLSFLIVCLFIISVAILPLAACTKNKSLEDILPKTYGKSEGLYLYSGNVKSRTDGSEKQSVLKSVEIDGVACTDFTVNAYAYSPSANKIFFKLRAGGKDVLYLYDYKTCDGKDLYSSEELEFYVSESYVYVKDEGAESGLLYSRSDCALLCDGIYGKLKDDLLFATQQVYDYDAGEWKNKFIWYNGGVQAAYGEQLNTEYIHRHSNYAYFPGYEPCALNLDDGTQNGLDFGGKVHYCNTVKCSDGIYTLTVHYENDEHIYTLFKLSGGKAETAYAFGNRPHGVEMGKANGTLYFKVKTSRNTYVYSFNAENGKMSRVSSVSIPKEKPERSQNFTVGGYTFYVQPVVYNEYQFPGYLPIPIPSDRYCYFLYREKDGKKEIMQYSTATSKLFDDIREF